MYPYSIKLIKGLIKQSFKTLKPINHEKPTEPKQILEHVLYMISEVETMKDAAKASRWIGYIYRCMESPPLEILSRAETLEMCKKDVRTYNKIVIELTREEFDKIMKLLEEDM